MNPAPVLYVEDEEHDVFFVRMAFQSAALSSPLQVVTDGAEAIDYLAGNGSFADRSKFPLPALVLLDLNLPLRSGFEVLQWLRQQPHFQALPVVVFTASARESDKKKAHQLGANDFLTKPANMARLAPLLEALQTRWLAKSQS